MASFVAEEAEGGGVLSFIRQTPCLRGSLITGLNSLIFMSFAQFFHSGIVKRATNWGYAGFLLGFGIYATGCNVSRYYSNRQLENLVREQTRRKEDAVRDMFGSDAVDAYDKMLKEAREAEERRYASREDKNRIA